MFSEMLYIDSVIVAHSIKNTRGFQHTSVESGDCCKTAIEAANCETGEAGIPCCANVSLIVLTATTTCFEAAHRGQLVLLTIQDHID